MFQVGKNCTVCELYLSKAFKRKMFGKNKRRMKRRKTNTSTTSTTSTDSWTPGI